MSDENDELDDRVRYYAGHQVVDDPIGAVVGCVDERDRGLRRGLLREISRGKSH